MTLATLLTMVTMATLLTLLTQPVTLTRTPARIATTAPGWGEHTQALLREAVYSEAEIAAMEASGVV